MKKNFAYNIKLPVQLCHQLSLAFQLFSRSCWRWLCEPYRHEDKLAWLGKLLEQGLRMVQVSRWECHASAHISIFFFLAVLVLYLSNTLTSEKSAILLSYFSERVNTPNVKDLTVLEGSCKVQWQGDTCSTTIGKQFQITSFKSFPSLLYLRNVNMLKSGLGREVQAALQG